MGVKKPAVIQIAAALFPFAEYPLPIACPLCRHAQTDFYHQDVHRPYHQCRRCALVFVPPSYRLAPAAEKAYYDLHDNDPADRGYRRFLSRLFTPMRERVPAPARGLDFGSGPGPTLSRMFVEAGYDMAVYDPYYAADSAVLQWGSVPPDPPSGPA